MTSQSRGPKRFTPTTIILIIALLAAVAGASRLATPAPPGPPEPPKKDNGMSAEQKERMLRQTQESEERMKKEMKDETRKYREQPVKDPNAIDPDNQFFLQTKPGSEGLKQNEEKVKEQTRAFEAYKRKLNADKKDGTPPTGQPRPEPIAPAK